MTKKQLIELYGDAISTAEREKVAASSFAGPHNSYPIRPGHPEDVVHAAELLHHASDPSAVKAKIIELAKKEGHPLPSTWEQEDDKASDSVIDPQAHTAATSPLNGSKEPTQRQKDSGNYRKGHLQLNGMGIAIENPSGSRRRPEWSPLSDHYGYIKGTVGKDKDHLDVFVKPGTDESYSGPVHVVNQNKADGSFDEHKVMIGWPDAETAKAGYLSNYTSGQEANIHSVATMPFEEFKKWAYDKEGGPSRGPLSVDSKELHLKSVADSEDEEIVFDDTYEMVSDSVPSGALGWLTQKCGRVNSRNANGRIYKREHAIDALNMEADNIRAGVYESELQHPEIVRTKKGNKFVRNPKRTTARSENVFVRDDGAIVSRRLILDTACGHEVWDAAQRGQPLGISMRWGFSGTPRVVDGKPSKVSKALTFEGLDDVIRPAVADAGELVMIADSVLDELCDELDNDPNGLTADSAISASAESSRKQEKVRPMKKELQRALAALTALITAGAPNPVIDSACNAVVDAYQSAKKSGEKDLKVELAQYNRLLADAVEGGYEQGATVKPITGMEMGTGNGYGFAPDQHGTTNTNQLPGAPATKPDEAVKDDKPLSPAQKWAEEQYAKEQAKLARKPVTDAVQALAGDSRLSQFSEATRKIIMDNTLQFSTTVDEVQSVFSNQIGQFGAVALESRKKSLFAKPTGHPGASNSASPLASAMVADRTDLSDLPGWGYVQQLCEVADDVKAGWDAQYNKKLPGVAQRRKLNFEEVVKPAIKMLLAKRQSNDIMSFLATDEIDDNLSLPDFLQAEFKKVADDTTATNMLNQAVIALFMLVQSFQDTKAGRWISMVGPGVNNTRGKFDDVGGGYGTAFRYPILTRTASAAGIITNEYTPGLLFDPASSSGVPSGSTNVRWNNYFPAERATATNLTRQVVLQMGNGPLNLPATAYDLAMAAWELTRVLDHLYLDEMLEAADRYGTVAVAAESVDLTNNTAYASGGSVIVNLNPFKKANAAVAAGDDFVQYGANVKLAARLVGPNAYSALSGYCGDINGIVAPVKRPETSKILNGDGTVTTSTLYPFAFTAPASGMVIGYLDDSGQIQTLYGGATPNYAVDWANGVVCFNGTGVAGSGSGTTGVITTTLTIATYNYVTNYAVCYLDTPAATLANMVTINSLLKQIDLTSGLMSSSPRFMAPNLAVSSVNASVQIVNAIQYFKLASPDGTELMTNNEEWYAVRNGVVFGRHNEPWRGKDNTILLTRIGTTLDAIDSPYEVRGPQFPVDSSYNPIPRDIYYGYMRNAICTPQVTDPSSGAIINPVARKVIIKNVQPAGATLYQQAG